MAKQPQFESFRHLFLTQVRLIADIEQVLKPEIKSKWRLFIQSLSFKTTGSDGVKVSWSKPAKGSLEVSTSSFRWYYQENHSKQVESRQKGTAYNADHIQKLNKDRMMKLITGITNLAGLPLSKKYSYEKALDIITLKHFDDEERLFNSWAKSTDINTINVVKSNEACTAPEMRYITRLLGNLKGKSLLDIGSGLGEASVYFALKGARVTAVDLSSEMLLASEKLARKCKTRITTIQAAAEYLHIPNGKKFDIIYAGNLFHHVDISMTLERLIPHLKPDGVLVCWEPVAYNPLINIYRHYVTQVRSDDEKPIRLGDIALFKKYFNTVNTRWFWLTTLNIFVFMVLFMRRDPNKIRLWKKIVEEGEKWEPIYKPLEAIDNLLLKVFPFLGPLSWNVVIECRSVKTTAVRL